MSTEEERAAIGGIVEDYGKCKTRLTALVSQALNSANDLRKVAEALHPTVQHYRMSYPPGSALDELIKSYPSREQVQQLLSDIHATSQQKRILEKQLSEVGLNVRD